MADASGSGPAVRVDVAVVGGGMVGASLACALGDLDLSVAVLEARSISGAEAPPSYDERTTAIAWSSRRIFEAVGVWPELREEAEPIRRIHVSEQGRFGVTHLDAGSLRLPALGYVIANRVLGAGLMARLRALDNVTLVSPARVESLTAHDDGVTLTLSADGRQRSLSCRLLVAADGSGSPVRDMLGIGVRRRDYRQSAVIATMTPERPHEGRAFERFTPDGPLALLPMTGGRCALVWTVPENEAERVLEMSDPEFLEAVRGRFSGRLGSFTRVADREAYPLSLVRAERLTAPRAALLGNAAHTLHPVAGQGFNLGLRDAAWLAENIAGADDPGDEATLRAFANGCRGDQWRTVRFSDGLVRLFGSALPGVPLARDAGLLLLDLWPEAKGGFARRATGLDARPPRLAGGRPLRRQPVGKVS